MDLDIRKCGYSFDKKSVKFYCSKNNYPDLQDFESVYVTGTFNGWLNTGDSSWLMKKQQEKGKTVFVLEKKIEDILVPGNSGFPEFKFFGLSDNSCHILGEKPGAGNVFLGNKLILFSDEDFEEVEKLNKVPGVYKELKDFDLNCPACRAELSNVRLVPGTKALYRGYHPCKKSRGWLDTENDRILLVRKALDLYGIKSDITLSGYEGIDERAGESVCQQLLQMENKNNRLCVNIDYNLVYFHSDAVEFLNIIQRIAKFILEHPAPYYLHCRLGSDKTGVIAAVFASLCGAGWKEIAEDFEKTNDCGIGEFRSRKILRYSLQRLTGFDPEGSDNLAYTMQSLFLKEKLLKAGEIEKLIKKLNTESKRKETDFFDFSFRHICAKKSANC